MMTKPKRDLLELRRRIRSRYEDRGIAGDADLERKARIKPGSLKPLMANPPRSAPKADRLIAIAEVLDVPINFLAEVVGYEIKQSIPIAALEQTIDAGQVGQAAQRLLPANIDSKVSELIGAVMSLLSEPPDGYTLAIEPANRLGVRLMDLRDHFESNQGDIKRQTTKRKKRK